MWKINKKNIYQSEEYKQFLFLRIISIVVIFIISLAACYGIYFIRKNVFNAIVQAEEIIILKNNLINEVIDFKRYENVLAAWTKKNEIQNIDKNNLRDPFNLKITTSTPQ